MTAQAGNSTLEIVSLILSVVSIVVTVILGVLSVWLSLHFKQEADKVTKDAQAVLLDVKTDAKAIAQFAAGELKSWGDVGRSHILGSSTGVSGTVTTNEPKPTTQTGAVASQVSQQGAAHESQ